jgi:hypothetical protein
VPPSIRFDPELRQVSVRKLNRFMVCRSQFMSGLLTDEEVAYLDKLIKRNRKLRLKDERDFSKPLHSPVTSRERQIRTRIRRKVLAGVIDILKIRASGVDSLSEINNALQLLFDKTLNSDERKMRDEILEKG